MNGTKNSILDAAMMPIEHPIALPWTKFATLPTFPVDKCQRRIQVSDEILMHRYKEEHIKMQIVSCQYFSRGDRIREGLPKKKNVYCLLQPICWRCWYQKLMQSKKS